MRSCSARNVHSEDLNARINTLKRPSGVQIFFRQARTRSGSVSVGQCIALLKAEVERKLASALIIFLGLFRVRVLRPAPGETAQNLMEIDGYNLPNTLPQLKSRKRAAHTETVSEHAFGQIGQNSRGSSNGFRAYRFRSSNPTTPASQSGLHRAKGEVQSKSRGDTSRSACATAAARQDAIGPVPPQAWRASSWRTAGS
jgi:hypothetical protein